MSNLDHLAKLLEGPQAWNAWRAENPDILPDLSGRALAEHADISRRLFTGIDLHGALMQDADLTGLSVLEADLTEASLEGADLSYCDLSRTVLAHADLSDANLTGANLANADLSGAILKRARLAGADLSLTVGLTNAQIRTAYCDTETLLPAYLDIADIYKDPVADEPRGEEEALRAQGGQEAAADGRQKRRILNPYIVLETTPQASAMELRNAYLRLAKKYHPDVNPGDAAAEAHFKDINEAYRRAAARSRLRQSAMRQQKRRSWAAGITFFVAGAAAASAAAYWLAVTATVEPRPQTAQAPAPAEPKIIASTIVKEAVKAESAAGSDNPLLLETAAPLAMSISAPKDGPAPAHAAAEAHPAPAPAPAEETASVADEPSHQQETSDAAPADDQEHGGDAAQAALLPDEPGRTVDTAPDAPSGQDTANAPAAQPAPAESAPTLSEKQPETVPLPQRMARLMQNESKENEFQAWQSTKEAGTTAAYRAYLINFPSGQHVPEAREHLKTLESEIAERKEDEAAWTQAQRTGTRAALQAYLTEYPEGRYVHHAKKKLLALDAKTAALHKEDEVWAKVKAENSREAYINYLNAYPNGRYAAQAQQTLGGDQSAPPSRPRRASRAVQSADTPEAALSPRWPSADEPFIERLPRP